MCNRKEESRRKDDGERGWSVAGRGGSNGEEDVGHKREEEAVLSSS